MPRLILSQGERLLLHLHEMDRFRDEMEVPIGASQEGMAQRLGTQVHNASRALASLQAEELVLDRLAHVRGAKKRRKAYFLTAKGQAAAEALISDLMSRRVSLEGGGERKDVAFEELARLSKAWCKSPSLFDLAEAARTDDVLTEASLRAAFGRQEVSVPSRSHGRPRLDAFFGREEERRELIGLLHDSSRRTILITGLPGIGKSTLASWAYEANLGSAPQLWHTLHEWEGEAPLLEELCGLFLAAGAAELSIRCKEGLSGTESYAALLKDLSAARPVLFIDDLHKAREALVPFLGLLFEAFRTTEGAKLVLISRNVPAWYPIGRPECARLELLGLKDGAARQMAAAMRAGDVEAAVRESQGHPLLLNLMAASGASRGKRDVTAFLDQEVGSSLTEAERETLEALSIHRQPVPVEALTARERDALPSLRRKGLLIEDEDGTWTHELLTSHFHSRLSGDRSRELHKSAAEFYLGQMEADYWMEGLYHAVEAQDSGQVLKALSLDGEGLALAFPEEMEALLQKIRRWDGLVGSRVDVLILLALAQEELGHETPALETYDEILRLLDGSSDVRIALALERKARLQAEARRWSQAFESHERALRLYQSSGDRAGEAGEWMSLGSAHRRRGDLAKARACFQSAWEVAERLGDLRVMAAALNNLALVEWDDGFPSRSEPLMERSVALAHQAEDLVGEARALQNLSSLLRAQAREGEALQRMAEAEAAFHRAGEVEECRKATVARAELFADLGREAEGIELLRKALAEPAHRTPFRRKGRAAQGEGRLREGLVRQLRECGRLNEAEQEALALEALAVRLDDARMAARAKIELAAILEDEGKEGGAVEALESAREELARVGDAAGLAVVHLRLGALARKVGDRGKALRELREAARQASLSGSLLAEASTLEDLGLALEEGEERESTLRRAYEAYSQIRRRADAERVHAYLDEG